MRVILPFFWRSEGPRDYPRLALKYFHPGPTLTYPGINIVIDTGFRGTSGFQASSGKANICPAATSIVLN